jgi:hypothetical protein
VTALIIAVDGAYMDIVRALLDAGASIDDVANVSSRCNRHVVFVVFVLYGMYVIYGTCGVCGIYFVQ